jgi:hypothetical protein
LQSAFGDHLAQALDDLAGLAAQDSERYQVFVDVMSGSGSQRDVADKWRIDRSTVMLVLDA